MLHRRGGEKEREVKNPCRLRASKKKRRRKKKNILGSAGTDPGIPPIRKGEKKKKRGGKDGVGRV